MSGRYISQSRLGHLERSLSDRDLKIINSLGQLHLLTGHQLRRLVFHNIGNGRNEPQLARRALLRLTRLGLLMRLERRIGGVRHGGSDGFVYRLSAAGERVWRRQVGETVGGRHRPEPGERFVAHRLLQSELYVRLHEVEPREQLEIIDFESEPACWRPFVGLGGSARTLKPDAFVRLGVGDQELWWFCEIDRGTVSQRTRANQAEAYRAYWRSGAAGSVMPRVLWLGTRQSVVVTARTAVQPERDPAGLFVVTTFDQAVDVAIGVTS